MTNNELTEEEFLTQKEIELTKYFYSMIKDTQDFFDEYCKEMSIEESINCKKCYLNCLEKALLNENEK